MPNGRYMADGRHGIYLEHRSADDPLRRHLDQSFSRAEFEHSRSILLRRLATKADLKPQAFTSMFHDTQLEQQHETRTELHGLSAACGMYDRDLAIAPCNRMR